MIVRELRLRDRSIVKIAQGSSVRFREKTRYAGLNRDGQACGMLVNNENVKIFLLGNQDISVSAQELPLEEVEEVEQQLAPLVRILSMCLLLATLTACTPFAGSLVRAISRCPPRVLPSLLHAIFCG